MPLIHITQSDGYQRQLDIPLGNTVMRGAVDAGVDGIIGECGGAAMCGTCHVFVDAAWLGRLPPMRRNEDELLDWTATPRQSNSRLGCQLPVTTEMDGLSLHLPSQQRS